MSNMEKERLIITIDFDNTIAFTQYPVIHSAKPKAAEVMRKWYDQGIFLIINFCRSGKAEWEMKTFLFDNKIPYHEVNEHASFIKQKYFNPHHPISRKILSHIDIDDTALDFMLSPDMNWVKIDEQVQVIIGGVDRWNVKPNLKQI